MAFNGYAPGEKEIKPPNIVRLLGLGHSIEYHALKFLETLPGYSIKFKQQVVDIFKLDRDGRIIEGSTDAVLISDQYKCLLDVKSYGDRFHNWRESKWKAAIDKYDRMESMKRFDDNGWYIEDVMAFMDEIGEDALVANITQINLYLCSDFMKARGIDHGVVYRYNKNDSHHMEIRFKPSQALFDQVRAKFNLIDQSVHEKKPENVPKDFALGSQACSFCPYAKRCWPEIDAKKEYFKTFPKKTWPDNVKYLDKDLRELLKKYHANIYTLDDNKILEQNIIKGLLANETRKVQLEDGQVYELVFLKSPKPHYELRRVNK